MGYSCTAAALRTLQVVKHLYGEDLEASNEIRSATGRLVFFEAGPTQIDGGIYGTVTDLKGANVGTFRINGDGTIARFAGLTKHARAKAVAIARDGSFRTAWRAVI